MMDELDDLERPIFTQKDVLRMLPDMKAKTLQNWASRGVLDVGDQKPGKQGKRLYTPLGVIMLDFMLKAGEWGIPPERSVDLADHIAEAALQFWASPPEIMVPEGTKHRWIPVTPEKMKSYRRAIIHQWTGHDLAPIGSGGGYDTTSPITTKSYFKFVEDLNDFETRLDNWSLCMLVEVDFLIAQTINRMFLLKAEVI